MKQPVLLTGCNGMLAREIVLVMGRAPECELFGTDIREKRAGLALQGFYQGDLTDAAFVDRLLDTVKPGLIIHTAALVDVNACEADPATAYRVHVQASRRLARYGARIVYISTDSVFNGQKGSYSENDLPDPLNHYAASKLLGEYAVQSANRDSLIVRTNIYGFNCPLGKSLVEWALKQLLDGKPIKGFTDIRFNAIYTHCLAEVILRFGSSQMTGLVNVASADSVSKYEFLRLLANAFGIDEALIEPCAATEAAFTVPRPRDSTLDVHRALDYVRLPTIREGIERLKEHFDRCYGKEYDKTR